MFFKNLRQKRMPRAVFHLFFYFRKFELYCPYEVSSHRKSVQIMSFKNTFFSSFVIPLSAQ